MPKYASLHIRVSDAWIIVVAIATALYIDPAIAQEQMGAERPLPLSEVVVTGSRIPQPNIDSVSPVTALNAEEIKLTGLTRTEDLLNNLPQAFAALGANLSAGTPGTANVNLRNLGAQRTLVLISGRRLMPGDPTLNSNGTPDLNQIPAALLERVDVLTGGASAVYGADAVAGVVNFIIDDHFQGVRLDANYTFNQHLQHADAIETLERARGYHSPTGNILDGYGKDVTAILGSNFADDRGNATAYLGYRRDAAVTQGARDFSACAIGSGVAFSCAGSSTSVPGRFFGNDGGDYTIGGADGHTLVPYTSANDYNYAPLNYFQRPDERYTAGAFAHYTLSDRAEVYSELMLMNDHTLAQIAQSGALLGTGNASDGGWLVNCNNPYLSASEVAAFCTDGMGNSVAVNGLADVFFGRRNVEGGPRTDDLTHTSYRFVIGLRGKLWDGWGYDTYLLDGTTRLSEHYLNDVSITKLGYALNAILDTTSGSPTFGQVVCAANAGGSNNAPGCVPYNPFRIGGVTPAAAAYISAPGFSEGSTTERIVSANIHGDLSRYGAKSPWAERGLRVSLGAEYREEQSSVINDQEFLSGDLAGQGGKRPNIAGQFHVWEGLFEARAPIVERRPLAQSLVPEVGLRYSSYSEGFNTTTYKLGLEWVPIEDIRLRGSYQQAVRAPNIQELFNPQSVTVDGATDPCAGPSVDGNGIPIPGFPSAAACAASGVPSSLYGKIVPNPVGQYNGLIGGNGRLQPEKSKTKSVGLVLTPKAVPDLNASVDYFDIDITGTIGPYGADLILGQCLRTLESRWCDLVHRAPSTASLWLGPLGYIVDTNFNAGALTTKGVDAAVDYRWNVAGNALVFSFIGTRTQSLDNTPVIGGGSFDCAGHYGSICGTPTPKWRHKLRATWIMPAGLEASLNWRHVGAVRVDRSSDSPLLSGIVPLSDVSLSTRDYLDFAGAYRWNNVAFHVGINNVTDKDPPTFGSSSAPFTYANGNTFPAVYDTLGRYVYFNATVDFR